MSSLEIAEAAYRNAVRVKEDEFGFPVRVKLKSDGSYEFCPLVDDVEEKEGSGYYYYDQLVLTRDDAVFNNAGGATFEVNTPVRIRRFLILGCDGGTFYAEEQQLALESTAALIKIILRGEGSLIVREVLEVSESNLAPRQEPTLFALALCARYRVHDTHRNVGKIPADDVLAKSFVAYIEALHKEAFSVLNRVCRIPTHLFKFVHYCELVSNRTGRRSTGWGRTMRSAIANWYAKKPVNHLALHVTKYRKREGWTHRDLFRLAHPTLKKQEQKEDLLEREQLYHFVVHGKLNTRKRGHSQSNAEGPPEKYTTMQREKEEQSEALKLVNAFLEVSRLDKKKDVHSVAKLIRKHGLVREHIPNNLLNSREVWQALLKDMPMTALLRNLGKMQNLSVFEKPRIQFRNEIAARLVDEDELKAARIHPLQILLALAVFRSGKGDKGHLKWKPNEHINEALQRAFSLSFMNVEPTGKRICLAFDVSGSECTMLLHSPISVKEAAAALGLIFIKTEPKITTLGFTGGMSSSYERDNDGNMIFWNDVFELPFRSTWKLREVMDKVGRNSYFGGTDCSLPIIWAQEKNMEFDAFIVITDCETWSGDTQVFDALRNYRKTTGIPARLVVVGMTATKFTIADPQDAGMLDVIGFDPSIPVLISNFILGLV